MVKIKICGLTSREDAKLALELGADALGCICTEQSKRNQSPAQIAAIFRDLPPFVTRVAVVQNPQPELLAQLAQCPIDYIQFHGEEPPQVCALCPLPWYKAVKGAAGYTQALQHYPDSPALLVDSPAGGGSGRQWDWNGLPAPQARTKPLILAGGLDPVNLAEAIARIKPWAVDVASGVESSPGMKDPTLLKDFIHNAKLVGC